MTYTKAKVIITHGQLLRGGACCNARRKFCEFFGDYVVVTVAKARRYYNEFDWFWAGANLLDIENRQAYHTWCTRTCREWETEEDCQFAMAVKFAQLYRKQELARLKHREKCLRLSAGA